ncbi:unnamed protein product [Acanthosepion pharaonis]|uniref:Uncharacterized protein n=1 Tax=Acanthosepion pharaonis TaxID=158019 RepID=A0A812C0V8_ACAPH|nr:unnamed protein product [Sepia pharaonis]
MNTYPSFPPSLFFLPFPFLHFEYVSVFSTLLSLSSSFPCSIMNTYSSFPPSLFFLFSFPHCEYISLLSSLPFLFLHFEYVSVFSTLLSLSSSFPCSIMNTYPSFSPSLFFLPFPFLHFEYVSVFSTLLSLSSSFPSSIMNIYSSFPPSLFFLFSLPPL